MKTFKFVPQGNYIVADLIQPEEKITNSGIIMPGTTLDRANFARVIAVGEGVRDLMTGNLLPIPIDPGDLVCINNRSYQLIELPDGSKIVLFGHGDVYGVVHEVEEDIEPFAA